MQEAEKTKEGSKQDEGRAEEEDLIKYTINCSIL
jgi:hypothetical protein